MKEQMQIVSIFIIALLINETFSRANSDTSFTFQVSDVELAKGQPDQISVEKMLQRIGIRGKTEDFSHRKESESNIINGKLPGLVQALHSAYQFHYPLKLSVSDFIILIGQGLSRHINNHVEDLRSEFVDFEGKKLIEIKRNRFILGAQNDWSTVFGEFADEIRKRVKANVYDVVIDDTSVATPTSRIVSEITLMDAMQGYFDYMVTTCCGIPQITLEGSREDWEKLREKVQKLQEMNQDNRLKLDWWFEKLVPTVNKICDTVVNKEVDDTFWNSIYKHESQGSGSSLVSGWITDFFPYLGTGPNSFDGRSIETADLPRLVSEVPFIWNYYGNYIDMNFYGGFLGAKFNKEDMTVQPVVFWSVNFNDEEKEDLDDWSLLDEL